MKQKILIAVILSVVVFGSIAFSAKALTQEEQNFLQSQISSLMEQVNNFLRSQPAALTFAESCVTNSDCIDGQQVCFGGNCINIGTFNVCSKNSDCGTDGYVDSPTCQGSNIYQNYKTFVCTNPGTINARCSSSVVSRLKQTCPVDQVCQFGECVASNTNTAGVACNSNSDCGADGYIGDLTCLDGRSIYQNYKIYICNDPGTTNARCSSATTIRLMETCEGDETCQNGACVSNFGVCSFKTDCGTDGYIGDLYCKDGNVYQNYKTYTCHAAGSPTSYCTSSINNALKTTCSADQTCQNGVCITLDVRCNSNSDCGTDGFFGVTYCQYGNVYQSYKEYICNNPGLTNSSCSASSKVRLKQTCSLSQTCQNGACGNNTDINTNTDIDTGTNAGGSCGTDSDCPPSKESQPYCANQNKEVWRQYTTYTCVDEVCIEDIVPQRVEVCAIGSSCSDGICSTTTTPTERDWCYF